MDDLVRTHICENFRMLVQNLVQEPDWFLPRQQTLVVDPVDHGGEEGSGSAGASADCDFIFV